MKEEEAAQQKKKIVCPYGYDDVSIIIGVMCKLDGLYCPHGRKPELIDMCPTLLKERKRGK
jgi:hypothetical protein